MLFPLAFYDPLYQAQGPQCVYPFVASHCALASGPHRARLRSLFRPGLCTYGIMTYPGRSLGMKVVIKKYTIRPAKKEARPQGRTSFKRIVIQKLSTIIVNVPSINSTISSGGSICLGELTWESVMLHSHLLGCFDQWLYGSAGTIIGQIICIL
jgi:hypothetical protein